MQTTAEKLNNFNRNLHFEQDLPKGVQIMNPFQENPNALKISSEFNFKYYNDSNKRRMILGVNPGRNGAGITGIPLTDTKRLEDYCHLSFPEETSNELSSVFFYKMISKYGGVEKFYSQFYVNAVCPLGFLHLSDKGNWINYNYYQTKEMKDITSPFILKTLQEQLTFNINTEVCFCLGKGKNADYLNNLNQKHAFFKKIISLEHPRYIAEYKKADEEMFIQEYLQAFQEN